MKRLILAASLSFLSFTCFAQASTSSKLVGPATTQEEYNYATKGLRTQRAQGLDMKAGYVLANQSSLPLNGATVTIEDLIRKGDQSLACIIIQVSTSKMPEPLYLAIPNASSPGEIFSQYAKTVSELDPAVAKTVLYFVSARLGGMEAIVVKTIK